MTATKLLWKAAEIRSRERAYAQRLNPDSHFTGTGLSRLAGMKRAHVTIARIPPGKDSFAYHAHLVEEEWVYILSGEGVAEIDGAEHAVGPGDFMGFPTPSVAHLLKNRGREDLVYLMGGEDAPVDVIDYPHLGKRYVLLPTAKGTEFYELGEPIKPFGPADRDA
ncbi:MAG: cupin domain-containing protein [Betaproteobacteria bacterium]